MNKLTIHDAACLGRLETVRKLIQKGVSVDSRDLQGHTPLHSAAIWGRCEVVQLLISSKCELNAVDYKGTTPVLIAASSDEKEVTDLLLCHGAQVNRVNQDGYSLLHYASRNGWADIVQNILNVEEEVNVNAPTSYGHTPLMLAAGANTGLEDCAKILLRAGADHSRRNKSDRTALHFAVFYNSPRVVRMLLSVEGLDINPQDGDGQTPLHYACIKEGCREVLKEILEAGADYNIRDNKGDTALSEGIRRVEFTVLTLEDIRLFGQQGLFLQEKEYVRIFQNSILKESVLKDVSLCTQSIVNKFHRQSLPALKSIRYFDKQLPNIDKFKLNSREIDEVEELVKFEIGRSNFCNVLKVHPMSLKALSILTLITY